MTVIIIGAGEVGYHIADTLSKEGSDVIVIDKNEEHLQNVAENLDVQTLLGSGSSPDILKKARMSQAQMLVAVTDSDETNMIACLIASAQSKVPIRVARIRNPELGNDLIFNKNQLNIDLCINPELEAVNHVMNLLDYPGSSEIFDFAGGRIKLVGFVIDEGCVVAGQKLVELREMYADGKVLITSIFRGEKHIVPSGNSTLQANDYVFAVTDSTEVKKLLRFFGKNTDPPRRIMIIGGGDTGLMLAEAIEKKGLSAKIIEKRKDRCEFLASRLNKTIIFHGNGTSHELLKQENIQETDVFIAVTNDEEANILGALLAKQMGAKKVLSLIRRVDYIPIVSKVGIDGVINPRNAAISKILHFIRKGKIISATPLRGEKAEAFEFIALETSDITNQPFKDMRFPKGTIVGAIVRGEEIIIPDGDSVIAPGDHVIIFTPREAVAQVEKFLTVKLEYFG
jgi:trk system potassium uptake protein TrkA